MVRAYAWPITVGKAPSDINFRYPETRLSSREYAPTNFRCAASASAELVLAGGQQPSGTDTSRSTTNSRSSGGRSPTTQLRLGSGIA